jgi:hypothetical protein
MPEQIEAFRPKKLIQQPTLQPFMQNHGLNQQSMLNRMANNIRPSTQQRSTALAVLRRIAKTPFKLLAQVLQKRMPQRPVFEIERQRPERHGTVPQTPESRKYVRTPKSIKPATERHGTTSGHEKIPTNLRRIKKRRK